MIKVLLIGLWGCIATAGGAYIASSMNLADMANAKKEEPEVIQVIRPGIISVPVIGEAGLRGYVLAQFSFNIREKVAKKITIPLDSLLADEAFRVVYASETEDFNNMRKKDLALLSKTITEGVNKRLGQPALADVLIEQLNYVSKEEIRRREAQ